ncbi:MAG: hypothetical protein M1829_001165, partial [Trizodia sp. TS-e1964]
YIIVSLREIRQYQKLVDLAIPRTPFRRLIREIADHFKTDLCFQATALEALQEATETYITELLGISLLAAIHANRITLMKKDMDLVKAIRAQNGRLDGHVGNL